MRPETILQRYALPRDDRATLAAMEMKFSFTATTLRLDSRPTPTHVEVSIRTSPASGDPIQVGTLRLTANSARRLAAELSAAAGELEKQAK